MTEYASAIALALRLIQKKGQPMVHRQMVDGTPVNPDEPWDTTPAQAVDTAVVGMDLAPGDMGTSYRGNGDIQQEDRVVMIPGSSLVSEPTLRDQIRFNDESWAIQHVQSVKPNGELVLVTLQVRR